jgi:hypothetical protein
MACNYLGFNIDALDLADATGNSNIYPYIDGAAYGVYTDCSGNTLSEQYVSVGIYSAATCFDDFYLTTVVYYKNDAELLATYSSFINSGTSCLPAATPTPTITPTPTPTPNSYELNVFSGSTNDSACQETYPATVYSLYSSLLNTLGVSGVLYQDNTLTTVVDPNTIFADGTGYAFLLDLASQVVDNPLCSVGPYTPTPTPTPSETPSSTPSSTPTATPPCNCTYYDVIVTSNDIDSSTGNTTPNWNNTVWARYYDCTTGSPLDMIFYAADPYYSTLCNNNAAGTPYLYYHINDVPTTAGITSTITNNSVCCTVDPTPTPTPDPTQTPSETPPSTPDVTPSETPTQTPSETPPSTPPVTPSETPTQTPTLSSGATPYPTTTPTPTPSETPPVTPSETPTNTPSETPPVTPSETPPVTPSETPPVTPSETPTNTPTSTVTPSPTPSITSSQTPTKTPTTTPTPSITSSQTPTQTQTPTATPTLGYTVQFVDCSNNTNIFRFNDPAIPSTIGVTYYITGSTSFTGCATSVINDGSGPQYDGYGVSFLMTSGGCGDNICPRSGNKAALLTRCSDGEVFYFNVEEDTAFVGAAYVYSGVCYSFVEFSGPGGDDIGAPLYKNCVDCLLQPSPTPTPYTTPTNTPTVSATPPACSYTTFCLSSTLPSLINYNGNYADAGTYNSRQYYSGDGITTAYIYYTGNYWCLSTSLGGTCILEGASPCYSQCPDIAANYFSGGVCPTPTPTPIDCNTFNFNAYFDCDWEPLPTPTPSIACDDVNFDISYFGVTPTPSPTGIICDGKAVSFSMSGYTPAVTPTVTLTPSVTITRTVEVQGQATFNMLDETFNCVSVKVLTNCNTGVELYTSNNLSYGGITVVIGMTFFASINDENVCVTYTRDDSNFSSNAIVSQIFQIYSNCANCSNVPTPTPSSTTTPTPTPSSTAGLTPTPTETPVITPSQTASQTPTPSPTSTYGSTPTQTPSQTQTPSPTQTATQTQTPTNSPTPSITKSPTPTPIWVYVYESCQQIKFGKITSFAQVIQTQQVSFTVVVGQSFKDDQGNCWVYNGKFDVNYIAPPEMYPITYQGDYFTNAVSTVYASCTDCLTPSVTTKQTITSVNAGMQPCIGGTIDDYMGASVFLDTPVTVDTTISVLVYFQYGRQQCANNLAANSSTSFTVTILAGESFGAVDACTQGQYFSGGATICGACAVDSDNPNINLGQYGC